MVYFGRAMAGTGSWEGTANEPGYITLDGDLQTLEWKVQPQHRPVRLVMYHEDSGGTPSVANVDVNYYYREKGVNKWGLVGGGVMNTITYNEFFGETYERQGGEYRLTLQGTDTHLIWVTPYNQYLQAFEHTGRRQTFK